MAPHSSPLAWKIPWTEEHHRLQSMGSSQTRLSNFTFHFSLSCMGEGNGNPLRCSCLENPRDGGAWWATVYGVAQSQTRLKGLSSLAEIDRKKSFQTGSKKCLNFLNLLLRLKGRSHLESLLHIVNAQPIMAKMIMTELGQF